MTRALLLLALPGALFLFLLCWLLRRPKTPPRRREVRLFLYSDADKVLREAGTKWTIAPEEDSNRATGRVYLQRWLEEPSAPRIQWRYGARREMLAAMLRRVK